MVAYYSVRFAQRQSYPSSDQSLFILTYGDECWIMNEKVRSRVQAVEMGFLGRISGLTVLNKVKSANIWESLSIKSLFLRLERSQLR